MKQIPNIYWETNYPYPPSDLERAWVQRWLELLDPNTSYVHTLPGVNVVGILNELTWGADQGSRTRFFLLNELKDCLNRDPLLHSDHLDREIQARLGKLSHFTDGLLTIADELFQEDGRKKSESQDETHFKSVMSHAPDELFRDLLNWLQQNNRYRNVLCDALETCLNRVSISDYFEIDMISKNLIFQLLAEGNYSTSYLSRECVETFLRSGTEDFSVRLTKFLKKFKQPQDEFTVYMRVQTRRTMQNVQQINGIIFRNSIPDIVSYIEQVSEQGKWQPEDEQHAKQFFYYGRSPENLIFAVATTIQAEDTGNAAIQALDRLGTAIQQAKFEYELRGFSIDRHVYVQNNRCKTLTSVSARQLRKARYGSIGDSDRLNRLLTWLSTIEKMYSSETKDANRASKRKIVSNITKTALAWHQNALEANTVETQFLNHWISLEQIFESVDTIGWKSKTADKAVLALAEALRGQFETQWLLDIWGDIQRLNVFGPPRILAPCSGYVEYSKALLSMPKIGARLPMVPFFDHSRPELFVVERQNRRKYRLPPGTVVLVRDGENINKDDWVAGAVIDQNKHTSGFKSLFDGLTPKAENFLYLALYHYRTEDSWMVPHQIHPIIDILHRKSYPVTTLIQAMRWYDDLEKLCTDWNGGSNWLYISSYEQIFKALSEIAQKLEMNNSQTTTLEERLKTAVKSISDYKSFFHIYETIRMNARSLLNSNQQLPDTLLFEAFRDETPLVKNMRRVFSKEDFDFATDQQLLKLRLSKLKSILNNNPLSTIDFITKTDRMRRTRNMIVHGGQTPKSLNFLVSLLYKFIRIYLREVIYTLGTNPDASIENTLFHRSDIKAVLKSAKDLH